MSLVIAVANRGSANASGKSDQLLLQESRRTKLEGKDTTKHGALRGNLTSKV
jgi:hypothetical protein